MSASIERCLKLLEVLSARTSVGFSQIDKHLGGVSHATLMRLLNTLGELKYIKKDPKSGMYSPGPLIANLSTNATTKKKFLIETYGEFMRELSTEYDITVILLERVKNILINVKREFTEFSPYMQTEGTVNENWTELWIMALATYEEELANRYTDEDDIKRLETIQKHGYYYDNMEKRKHARRIAFPIFDKDGQVIAIFGIGGNPMSINEDNLEEIINKIKSETGLKL